MDNPTIGYKYIEPNKPFNFELHGPLWPMYVDIETYAGDKGTALDVRHNRIRLISVTFNKFPMAFVFDMMGADDFHWNRVFSFLEAAEELHGFNLAFDLATLVRHGMKYPKRCRDSMIASQVLANGILMGHSLAEVAHRQLNVTLDKSMQVSDWGKQCLDPKQIEYSAKDVLYLPQIHHKLMERLELRKLMQTYELECGFLPAVVSMSLNGVLIDRDAWLKRSIAAEEKLVVFEKELLSQFPLPEPEAEKVVRTKKNGEPFAADVAYNNRVREANANRKWNLASPTQVEAMFKAVGLELPNTRYETLTMFRDDHPAMPTFLKWRDVEKEATTFGREWLKHVDDTTGRVYPSWNQLRAESGRMSCSSPNMQQIPRGAARKGIVAPPGYVFVRADFSQIEARVAAKISGDPVLTKLFMDNDDIHAYAAKKVLGKLSVTPEERQIGKSLVFGLLFSMSAPSLMVYCRTNYGVSMTLKEAEVYRERFFQTFHGLAKWHDRMRHVCNQMNEFRTLIGRRRIVMNVNDNLNMLGLALNTPVQGTAADLLKISVRECWERREEFSEMNLVMLVHDEVVYECPEDRAEAGGKWLRGIMIEAGNAVLDPIPCDAAVKVGATWGG